MFNFPIKLTRRGYENPKEGEFLIPADEIKRVERAFSSGNENGSIVTLKADSTIVVNAIVNSEHSSLNPNCQTDKVIMVAETLEEIQKVWAELPVR